MSNVFVKGTASFYPVPQCLVSSGLLRNLSGGALKLYQLILYAAQHRTRVELELSNLEVLKVAGLSPNTIRRARTELKEARLIDLRQAPGGRYTYVILNPLTGAPLPHPRSPHGSIDPSTPSIASTPPAPLACSVSWAEISK